MVFGDIAKGGLAASPVTQQRGNVAGFKKALKTNRGGKGSDMTGENARFGEACTDLSTTKPVKFAQENTEYGNDLPKGSTVPWRNRNEQARLAKVAMAFAGTPYKEGGSTIRGLDCSAFVKKVYEIFGVRLPKQSADILAQGAAVPKEDLKIGDIMFFASKDSAANRPPHVGVFVGNNRFVHASSYKNRGVRVDSLDSKYGKFYIGAMRVRGQPEGKPE